jgi:hypothetical protein
MEAIAAGFGKTRAFRTNDNMNVQSPFAEIALLIRSIARLLVSGVLMSVGLLIMSLIFGPAGPKRPAPRKLVEGNQLVSPNVQMVVVALTVFSIIFGAFYLNIRRAKSHVSYWKPGSSYWFLRSNGLLGVKARATRVWMKELGYEEPEALIIARYQECALVMTFAGIISLAVIFSILVGP